MVENVIQKINLLMSMAGSNNTSEALQDEAEGITKEIIRLEKQLEQLRFYISLLFSYYISLLYLYHYFFYYYLAYTYLLASL